MATPRVRTVLDHLRQLAGGPAAAPSSDRQLLARFVQQHDEEAFRQLVQRHGPMVLGLCRRLLGNAPDADDAFQATFLVLVRRAGSLAWHDGIGPWLYQVAHRVVRKARTAAARRRALDQQGSIMPPTDAPDDLDRQELTGLLHEELDRLPARYRDLLVLCYLQGKTHAEAAAELRCPRGSLARRLDRAQELLRDRLVGRGFALSVGLAVLLTAEQATLAAVPAPLLAATVDHAMHFNAGGAGLSAAILALVDGVIRAMVLDKLRAFATLALTVALVAAGLSLVWPVGHAADVPPNRAEPAAREGSANVRPLVSWSGPNSQLADASYRRISSAAEWQALWLAHRGKKLEELAGEAPEVDFRQCMAVVIFQGAQANCRGVKVVSVEETQATITFRFVGDTYQTLNKVDEVTPFGLFLLPRSTKALILEENVQRLLNGPPEWRLRAQFDALAALPARPAPEGVVVGQPAADGLIAFDREVQPILQRKCQVCHADKKKGGFSIRTFAAVLAGGDSGPGIRPGAPEQSMVWREISEGTMPPKGELALTAAEKDVLLAWIKSGAREFAVATDAAAVRERIRQVGALARADGSALGVKIAEACDALRRKDVELVHRFSAPDLTDPGQVNTYHNRLQDIQKSLGLTQFRLAAVLEELEELRETRNVTPKLATAYDYICARLALQVALVHGYNARLGGMRKEFPPLDPKLHDGWELVPGGEPNERDSANYLHRARQYFEQIARDEAGNVWEKYARMEMIVPAAFEWRPTAKAK